MRSLICLLLLFSSLPLFAAGTGYADTFSFSKISDFTLTNIRLLENGSATLAYATESLYEAEEMVWSIAAHSDGILVGAGLTASLIFVDEKGSGVVYSDENFLLFSEIASIDGDVFAAPFPSGGILQLNDDFEVIQTFECESDYIWDIVESDNGFYALCGNPASLYEYDGKSFEEKESFEDFDNLITGTLFENKLYFAADEILFSYDGASTEAVNEFSTEIIDMEVLDGKLFLITSSRDTAAISGRASEKNQVMDSYSADAIADGQYSMSKLYRIYENGLTEELFSQTGMKFLALSVLNQNLVIGTDKDGGYFEIASDGTEIAFTALGEGKFVKMMNSGGSVFALTAYPDTLIEISSDFAKSGSLTSSVFELENLSTLGEPYVQSELFSGTSVDFFCRGGKIENESYFSDWTDAEDAAGELSVNYFQYRVELSSSGSYSPVVKSVSYPYLSENLPPHIASIDSSYGTGSLSVKWTATDENDDDLLFDVFLSYNSSSWISFSETPLSNSLISLPYQAFPSGAYRVKVVASDEMDNPTGESLSDSLISGTFRLDNEAPAISDLADYSEDGITTLRFTAMDDYLPLHSAVYCINGGSWQTIYPTDGILDGTIETFELSLEVSEATIVQFKVSDAFGNASTKGILLNFD